MRDRNMDGWVGDSRSLRNRRARPGFERRFFSEENTQGPMQRVGAAEGTPEGCAGIHISRCLLRGSASMDGRRYAPDRVVLLRIYVPSSTISSRLCQQDIRKNTRELTIVSKKTFGPFKKATPSIITSQRDTPDLRTRRFLGTMPFVQKHDEY